MSTPVKQHPLYAKWQNIKNYTSPWNLPNSTTGRKLKLQSDWNNFESFAADIEAYLGLPKAGEMLIRRDQSQGWTLNNLFYSKKKTEQGRRYLRCQYVRYQGRKYCVKELARKMRVNYHTVRGRLQRGWTVKEAVETRTQRKRYGKK